MLAVQAVQAVQAVLQNDDEKQSGCTVLSCFDSQAVVSLVNFVAKYQADARTDIPAVAEVAFPWKSRLPVCQDWKKICEEYLQVNVPFLLVLWCALVFPAASFHFGEIWLILQVIHPMA